LRPSPAPSADSIPPTPSRWIGRGGTGLRILPAALVAYGMFILIVGAVHAWRGGDVDMGQRLREYSLFRRGVYPCHALETDPGGLKVFSVYPPYAFLLFTPFFEPEGGVQGRLMIESLSVASLMTIGLYAWRRFKPTAGTAVAATAATLAAAIAGNGNAFALGQFSIICMGLIAQVMILLGTGKPVAAGICWALAMTKPQIALCFAPLFLFGGNIRGLVCGVGVLGILSLAACEWTEVSLRAVADHWFFRSSLGFNGHAGVPRAVAAWTGLSQRHLVGLGLVAIAGTALGVRRRLTKIGDVDLLPIAGLFAVIGALAFYHRHYDYIMLWPTLLAAFAVADRRRDRASLAIVAAMFLSLVIPERWLKDVPYQLLVRSAVWGVTGVWAFVVSLPKPTPGRQTPRQSSSSSAGSTAHSG
jgi:Glycosyltransferase family 87